MGMAAQAGGMGMAAHSTSQAAASEEGTRTIAINSAGAVHVLAAHQGPHAHLDEDDDDEGGSVVETGDPVERARRDIAALLAKGKAQALEQLRTPDQPCAAGEAAHCRPWQCVAGMRQYGLQQRVRKEVHDLTDEEFAQFHRAMRALHKRRDGDFLVVDFQTHFLNKPFRASLSDLVLLHSVSHKGHKNDNFYPFHRRMLLDAETELQVEAKDCSMTLPYWNWAVESHMWDQSSVWAHDRFGSLPMHEPACVADGMAANWTYLHEQGGEQCLLRGGHWANWTTAHYRQTLPTWASLQSQMRFDDYKQFRAAGEIWHNRFHCMVHGDMCHMKAPRDPLFYAHHSMIDRFYYKWQEMHAKGGTQCGHCSFLADFGKVPAQEYTGAINTTAGCVPLPFSDPVVCVSYQEETHRPDLVDPVQPDDDLSYNCRCIKPHDS